MEIDKKMFSDNTKIEIVGTFGHATRTVSAYILKSELVKEYDYPYDYIDMSKNINPLGELRSIKLVLELDVNERTGKLIRIKDKYETK